MPESKRAHSIAARNPNPLRKRMQDCITNDESGLLCDPRSPDDLARQLQRLIADPALRRRLGQRARADVEQRFSHDVVFGGFASLFEQVFSARQAR